MRTLNQCLKLKSSYSMTKEERSMVREWLDKEARYTIEIFEWNCLLGWFILDQHIPLSAKEAGFK